MPNWSRWNQVSVRAPGSHYPRRPAGDTREGARAPFGGLSIGEHADDRGAAARHARAERSRRQEILDDRSYRISNRNRSLEIVREDRRDGARVGERTEGRWRRRETSAALGRQRFVRLARRDAEGRMDEDEVERIGKLGSRREVFAAAADERGRRAQEEGDVAADRKSTRLNSSHVKISYAVFCLKKKKHT